jgi:hypothetical protein
MIFNLEIANPLDPMMAGISKAHYAARGGRPQDEV